MYDVVTIGDIFQDLFIRSSDFKVIVDRSFKSGKSLSFDYGAKLDIEEIEYHSGGSAANTALCFARAGLSASIISFLSPDSFGEKILSEFSQAGVDCENLKNNNQPTNVSVILTSHGDRTILSYHGENDYNQLPVAKNLKTKWFYLAPVGKEMDKLENKIIEHIAKSGAGLIWNPGQSQIKLGAKSFRHLLQLTNILFLNREETLIFSGSGQSQVENSMKVLHGLGAKIIVVTDGAKGAKCFDGSVYYQIDPTTDKRIDATGAGDAFASAFSTCVIKNCREKKAQKYLPERGIIEQSLKWGIIVSGSVVSQVGAHSGLLSSAEISEREKKLVKLEPLVYTK